MQKWLIDWKEREREREREKEIRQGPAQNGKCNNNLNCKKLYKKNLTDIIDIFTVNLAVSYSFQTTCFCWIRTRIVRMKGEHTDHYTTAQLTPPLYQLIWNSITKAFCVSCIRTLIAWKSGRNSVWVGIEPRATQSLVICTTIRTSPWTAFFECVLPHLFLNVVF